MNYQETIEYLYQLLPVFHREGKKAYKADLNNTLAICEHLGNPQHKFKSIHVGGTNGKGSSSHFLASILQEAGYKTGLYTSPHLKSFTERIRINGRPILEQEVVDYVERNKSFILDLRPSFFECTVGLAFEYFASQNVDIAIIEVGLGGRLDLMVSGSAALQPRLTRVFAAAEIPVMEGYGLSETSPVIAVNDQRNKGFKIGTVGKPIRNVEVKIAEDGEILCKGPNVMLGYFKDPEKTAEALQDGYFHTGDIGEIDSEGFLKITDRKKEMFKTSGGKYIAPQLIENAMKQSRFIEQIMVIGEGEKMPAAFIQPNFEFVKEWAKIHKITLGNSDKDISSNAQVIKRIDEEVETINEKFGHWEKIKRFELTPDVWSIDGGQLTPTLKLKRKIIKEIYKDLYAKIYGQN